MDVAVEMPGPVEGFVPRPHGIVVQPDLLAEMFDHALPDDPIEDRVVRRQIVVAAHEMHVAAADPPAVGPCHLERGERKIPDDPERVTGGDAGIDGVDDLFIVPRHRFGRHLPAAAPIDGRARRLLLGKERPLAIADDVAPRATGIKTRENRDVFLLDFLGCK